MADLRGYEDRNEDHSARTAVDSRGVLETPVWR
jgi:hypothetical protein